MSYKQEEELVEYVRGSRDTRQKTYLELSLALFEGQFSKWVIKRALYRQGFRRRVARQKPPISETNRVKRLDFAEAHKDWTPAQWAAILWTDETWVNGGTHRQVLVTRRAGEEWDPTCIVDKHQRKQGWMFCGCFSGQGKGPGILWEKDWGTVTKESYQEHTVPAITGWIEVARRDGETLSLTQDSASAHKAKEAIQDLSERGIEPALWPPFSHDLNPIETCWDWMKDYIEDKHGQNAKTSYDQLREYVKEAWEALPDEFLQAQIAAMPDRMAAVITANGLHTKY